LPLRNLIGQAIAQHLQSPDAVFGRSEITLGQFHHL